MANFRPVEHLSRAVSYMACSSDSPLKRLRTAYSVYLVPRYTRGWPQELQGSLDALNEAMYEGINTDASAMKIIARIVALYGEAERLYQQELLKERISQFPQRVNNEKDYIQ